MKKFYVLICVLISVSLYSVPIRKYDFHRPAFTPSAITSGLGGHNVSYSADPYAAYNNPALTCFNKKSKFSMSLRSHEEVKASVGEILSAETLFKKSELAGMVFSGEKFSLSYIPLADISEEYRDTTGFHEYADYSLNSVNLSIGEMKGKNSWGITMKALWGRMVYMEDFADSLLDFQDDKAMGFSTDLGFARRDGAMTYGITVYDVLSHLYWEDSSNKNLTTRYSVGSSYSANNNTLSLSWLGKISSFNVKDYTLHGGYSLRYPDLRLASYSGDLLFRFGIYGDKFKKSEDTFLTWGMGLYLSSVRIDLSLINNDLSWKNNRYIVSISAGL
jgi:hypothetical protein